MLRRPVFGPVVDADADVNERGGFGRTPLHIAALYNPVAFPMLLELGADPEALDRDGRTLMDYTVDDTFGCRGGSW
ncbi:ankyrin repeat domain-containing protein [Candidatus Palauibacter soopunensis]|uniref:ankyrin repeat domain-containing protein n=1 Tax=Candidatus Palauibacter soopunensis TaxID=3056739 RepID=UPI002873A68C|nr:ankyrin repeat domain-containing protein [Candidatus Palauibacter soopunensis]